MYSVPATSCMQQVRERPPRVGTQRLSDGGPAQSRLSHLKDKLKTGYKDQKVKIVGAKGNSKWDIIYPFGVEGKRAKVWEIINF